MFLNPKHNENILSLYKKTNKKKLTTTYRYRDEGEMRGRVEGRGEWTHIEEGVGQMKKEEITVGGVGKREG